MSKRRKTVLTVLISLVLTAVLTLYAVQVFGFRKSFAQNLAELVFVVVCAIFALVKIHAGRVVPRPLSYYEDTYALQIKSAFLREPTKRKTVLKALREYHQERYAVAEELLLTLLPHCCQPDDHYAVRLFLGICQAQQQRFDAALEQYETLERMQLADSTVYGYMAVLYWNTDNQETAFEVLDRAAEREPDNACVHYNRAVLFFYRRDFQRVILSAERALEIDTRMYHAAALLAIVYTVRGELQHAETYKRMAISNGQNAEKLETAIREFADGTPKSVAP